MGVRDKVCFRAKGWLGFMYYGPKLFKFNSLWRRILKEKQNHAETQSAAPLLLLLLLLLFLLSQFYYGSIISSMHLTKKFALRSLNCHRYSHLVMDIDSHAHQLRQSPLFGLLQ